MSGGAIATSGEKATANGSRRAAGTVTNVCATKCHARVFGFRRDFQAESDPNSIRSKTIYSGEVGRQMKIARRAHLQSPADAWAIGWRRNGPGRTN